MNHFKAKMVERNQLNIVRIGAIIKVLEHQAKTLPPKFAQQRRELKVNIREKKNWIKWMESENKRAEMGL